MIQLTKTDAQNTDFQSLVNLLDEDLRSRYGVIQDQYDQYNDLSVIPYVVVAHIDGETAGCGAFKEFDTTQVEIKRVFVKDEHRGQGVGRQVITALEDWARELGYKACVLETGDRQHEAIDLYHKKLGYQIIPNYGQYTELEHSVCMRKAL